MKNPLLILSLVLLSFPSAIGAVTVSPQSDGLHISSDGGTVSFLLEYPNLVSADKKKNFKPSED